MVTVLRWYSDLREVPIITDGFFQFLSVLALLKELIRQFVLRVDPLFDLWILRVFHITIRIVNLHFGSIFSDVFGEFSSSRRFTNWIINLTHVKEVSLRSLLHKLLGHLF